MNTINELFCEVLDRYLLEKQNIFKSNKIAKLLRSDLAEAIETMKEKIKCPKLT